jgi:hypothetical protein
LLVVIESSNAPLPSDATRPGAIVVTPEALDLLVSDVNPALWWAFPPAVASLVRQPDREALHRQAHGFASLWRLCGPGLHPTTLDEPARRLTLASELADDAQTRHGWEPPEPKPELVPTSRRDYYTRVYPLLRAQRADVLSRLEEPRVETAVA